MLIVGGHNLVYEVKHYEEGSEFGINGGKISKLFIKDLTTDEELVGYDRGWDRQPNNAIAREAYTQLLRMYN